MLMSDCEFVFGNCLKCGQNRQLHPKDTHGDAFWCIECIPLEERLRALQVSPLIDITRDPHQVQVSLQCGREGCEDFLYWQARPPRSLDRLAVLDCTKGGCDYTCRYDHAHQWRFPFKPGDKLAYEILLRLLVSPDLCEPRSGGSIGRHVINLDGTKHPLMIWEYDDEPPIHHPVALARVPRCVTTPMWFVATRDAVNEILAELGFPSI